MKNNGKLISLILSLLFLITGYYIYYLLNHIPEYFYTQLSERHVPAMLYGLLIPGLVAIIYTFLFPKKYNKASQYQNHKKSNIINKEIQLILSDSTSDEYKTEQLLSVLCKNIKAKQGIVYKISFNDTKSYVRPIANFNYTIHNKNTPNYEFIKEEEKIRIINHNLKSSSNKGLVIIPLTDKQAITGILELEIPASLDATSSYIINNISNEMAKLVI